MFVFADQRLGRPNLAAVQAMILRQFNLRLKPELRFAVSVVHMNVQSGFLTREEKEPETILPKDRWAQWLPSRQLTFPISRRSRGRLHRTVMRHSSRPHPIRGRPKRPDGTSVPSQEPLRAPLQGSHGHFRSQKWCPVGFLSARRAGSGSSPEARGQYARTHQPTLQSAFSRDETASSSRSPIVVGCDRSDLKQLLLRYESINHAIFQAQTG